MLTKPAWKKRLPTAPTCTVSPPSAATSPQATTIGRWKSASAVLKAAKLPAARQTAPTASPPSKNTGRTNTCSATTQRNTATKCRTTTRYKPRPKP
ncbi:MAG: hypothetical protein ACFNT5_08870 [Cardiobacterium hominis]